MFIKIFFLFLNTCRSYDFSSSMFISIHYRHENHVSRKFCKLCYQTVKRRANKVENVLSLIFVDETNYSIVFKMSNFQLYFML